MQISSKLNQFCRSEIDDHLRNTFFLRFSFDLVRGKNQKIFRNIALSHLPMKLSPYPRQPPAQCEMHIRRVTTELERIRKGIVARNDKNCEKWCIRFFALGKDLFKYIKKRSQLPATGSGASEKYLKCQQKVRAHLV